MLPEESPTRVQRAFDSFVHVDQFLTKYEEWAMEAGDQACDFAVGNPYEMPLEGFVKALEKAAVPKNKEWHAHKLPSLRQPLD